jgi:DNA-binding CsgD family transcriptional regulator/tetratricopeptide (TPR) repeat protein
MAWCEDSGLVGRGAALSVFESAVAQLGSGRGGVVLVQGEPGIGKSALLEAAGSGARAAGVRVLRAQCDELDQGLPLVVMSRLVGAQVLDPQQKEDAQAAQGFSRPSADPAAMATERVLREVDSLCATGPLLLVVDDLQWADEPSLLVWRRLVRVSSQLPLLVVASARPVPAGESLDALRRDVRSRGGALIVLGGLDDDEVRTLASQWIGAAPGERLLARLGSAAGNPLYLRELFDALTRSGALAAGGGARFPEGRGAADEATSSLAGAIADRLSFLSAQCRSVLRTAALLGPDFSGVEVGGIVDLGPVAVVRLLQEGLDAGVLESVGPRMRFRHGLIKQALYEATPASLRTVLLRHAAQWLIGTGATVERIARLLSGSLDAMDGWEADWLAQNLDLLVGRAPTLVVDLLESALRQLEPADPRAAVFQDSLAVVAFRLQRYELAERITRGILAGTAAPEHRGQAAWTLGYTLQKLGKHDEALAMIADVRAGLGDCPVWDARLASLDAILLGMVGRLVDAGAAGAAALELGERCSDALACAQSLNVIYCAHVNLGDLEKGEKVLERALATAVDTDPSLVPLRLVLLGNYATLLAARDRAQDAQEVFRQAVALAEYAGPTRMFDLYFHLAEIDFEHGRWDEALATLEMLEELDKFEDILVRNVCRHAFYVTIAAHRADSRMVAAHLGALGDAQDKLKSFDAVPVFFWSAAALAAEREGRNDDALRILGELVDAEPGKTLLAELILPTAVRLALDADDQEFAVRAAAACPDPEQAFLGPLAAACAAWCRGLLRADPADLDDAGAYFRSSGRRIELGNVLEDLAVVEARSGRLEQSRQALEEAMTVYTELGAVWDGRRAGARLRSAGLHTGTRGPRRRASTGQDSLTHAERQIAALVAQGDSNTAIAERLVLSRRTVETHVSRILAKLQIHSRAEVGPLLTAQSG